jgi:hypothetical protein
MKSMSKKKASKITFKAHKKHRELPKDEKKTMSESMPQTK